MYLERPELDANRDSRWAFRDFLRAPEKSGDAPDRRIQPWDACQIRHNIDWDPMKQTEGAYSLLFVSTCRVCESKLCQGETYSLDDDEDMAIKEIQNLWIFEERNTDNMFTELPLEMCCRTGGNGRKYYQHQTLIILVKWDVVGFQERFY